MTGRRLAPQAFAELSPREQQILDVIARALGNVAIASRLSVAPKTVRNSVSVSLAKIGAADRADAISMVREAELGSVSAQQ